MFPAVVPWDVGPVIPVGMLPATTAHWTGVGVAPLLKVVLHPVVWKNTVDSTPRVSDTGSSGVITQLPVGGAGHDYAFHTKHYECRNGLHAG